MPTPDRIVVFGDIPRLNAERFPNKTALVDRKARMTWAQVQSQSERFCNLIRRIGARRGDRMAIISSSRHEWMICVYGAAKAGVSVVPIGNYCSAEEIRFMLEETETCVVVADEASAARVAKAAVGVSTVRHLIAIGDTSCERGWLNYAELLNGENQAEPAIGLRADDELMVQYTSGSTGRPKGIILGHRQIVAMARICVEHFGVNEADVGVICVPVNHKGPFNKLKTHAWVGATVVMLGSFDAREFLGTIERERVTNISAFPSMFQDMFGLEDFHRYDLNSLRRITVIGTVMPRGAFEEAVRRFPGVEFQHAYGLTDAGGLMSMHSSRERPDKLGCVGRTFPEMHVEIHDGAGRSLPRESTGEIVCRGESIMTGYLKQPDLTREVLRGGWLHTGDLGKIDSDGYLWLVGRLKDMIKTGGENVAPIEVENALSGHPAVERVAVFGVADARWGEAVAAAVVLRAGHAVTESELIDYCGARIARFKKPKRVYFVDGLPENPLGTKVLKEALKARFGAQEQLGTP